MRVALLFGSVILLATGCAGPVPRVSGFAAPIAAPSSPAASPTPGTTEGAWTPPVLGPDGLGALKLGMTTREAARTNLIEPWLGEQSAECTLRTHLVDADGTEDGNALVLYSDETGVEVIEAYENVRTPQGIRIGSSKAAMLKAYPKWENASEPEAHADGRGLVTVPGNKAADYRIVVEDGKVTELTLQYKKQNCYE